ncbi:larval cuticle protein III/IV [Scaptodrosophila lebanonensis]|uniref:Larval cuticle protein III/IV n=1 Tax=Drosophila lebanonensis TaxID=7225 RepID=A0A6J2UEE9_DROLE|nr:larval cuticle protein III/IV [Scaptodrosophila lebanonensis]
MYKLIPFIALLACALAAPAEVVRSSSNVEADGSYGFVWELNDGTSFQEQGVGGQGANGAFAYISPEGLPVQLSYVADQNGFQPNSDLLPTPPPIPEEILRSIRYIQEHPTPEELADRAVRASQI